jgi:cytochrome c oxidase assembly protein subunit 15
MLKTIFLSNRAGSVSRVLRELKPFGFNTKEVSKRLFNTIGVNKSKSKQNLSTKSQWSVFTSTKQKSTLLIAAIPFKNYNSGSRGSRRSYSNEQKSNANNESKANFESNSNEQNNAEFGDRKATAEERHRKAVGYWLFLCAGLVFIMVIVGGVTRLTESGLSITEWRPLTGTLPPMSEEEWMVEFEKYKNTPEYVKLNPNMKLNEFKKIYYMEYAHRLLGRVIGVVFGLPFFYFLSRGAIRGSLLKGLTGLFALGGAQGALGWYMVKSGLEVEEGVPRVSQYRLAAHLCTAFVIYVGLFWLGLGRLAGPMGANNGIPKSLMRAALGVGALTFTTAASGAFVAGLDAGLVYNTFPFMGDGLVPPEYWEMKPKYKNFFDNDAAVQFNHRLLATTTFCSIVGLWVFSRKFPLHRSAQKAVTSVMHMASLQVALGITTLLLLVPVPWAAAHQGGSLTLLTLMTWFIHELKRAAPKSVKRL